HDKHVAYDLKPLTTSSAPPGWRRRRGMTEDFSGFFEVRVTAREVSRRLARGRLFHTGLMFMWKNGIKHSRGSVKRRPLPWFTINIEPNSGIKVNDPKRVIFF